MVRFIVCLIVLSLVLVGSIMLAYDQGWLEKKPSFLFQTVFILAFGSGLIYRKLYRVSKPADFVQLYLLLIVVELIAFLGYNIFMVMADRPGIKYNVIFFLLAYFAFTTLKILFLYRLISSETEG